MTKNKLIRTVLGLTALMLMLALLVVLESCAGKMLAQDAVRETLPTDDETYNSHGLSGSDTLSDHIIFEDDMIVCYSDRILRKFTYKEENFSHLASCLSGMLESGADIDRVVVMPIPLRITLEEGREEESAAYREYVGILTNTLPEGAVLADVYPLLEQHREEYLFFRTEDSWTARGSYYAIETLGDVLGFDVLPLSQYEEYMYRNFLGSTYVMARQNNAEDLQLLEKLQSVEYDPLYYYLLPDAVNRAEVFLSDEGEERSVKRPFIAVSENGTNTFGGTNWDWAIVEGDGVAENKKDRVALLVSDYNGRIMIPFLANYYDQVCAVQITEFRDFPDKINELFARYPISDVIIVQSALTLGDRSYSRAINGFAGQ